MPGGAVLVGRRVRKLSPHQLRHGFANRFLRESGRDVVALQALMGHSRSDTTQQCTDDVVLDELAATLQRVAEARYEQASPELATLESDVAAPLGTVEWRRRESNPRPRTHRRSVYKLRPGFDLDCRQAPDPPTDSPAILESHTSGDWRSFGASPFVDAVSGPRAQLGATRYSVPRD